MKSIGKYVPQGSSLTINPFDGLFPVPCDCGSCLVCDQACARLFRAPVSGQRDQELVSGGGGGGGIDGAGVAVGAGLGEGAVAGADTGGTRTYEGYDARVVTSEGAFVVGEGAGAGSGTDPAAGSGMNTCSGVGVRFSVPTSDARAGEYVFSASGAMLRRVSKPHSPLRRPAS